MSLNEVSGSFAGIRFGRGVELLLRLRPGEGGSLLGPGSAPADAVAPGVDFARDLFGFPAGACPAASDCTGPSAVTVEGDGVVDGAAFLELDRVLFRVGDCASLAPVSAIVAVASTGADAAGCAAPAAFLRGLRVVGEGFAVSGSSVEVSSLDAADFDAALVFACFLAVRLFLVAVFFAACGDEPVGSGGAGTGSTGAVDGCAASGVGPLLEVVPRFGRREVPGAFVDDEVGPSDGEGEPDGPPPGPEPGAEGVPPPPPGGIPPPPGGFGREDNG
jgi:hypothetical protein